MRLILFLLGLSFFCIQNLNAEKVTSHIKEKNAANSFSDENTVFKLGPVDYLSPKIKKISQKLSRNKILRANFKQSKKIAILRRPLISLGTMLYAEEYGLYWHIDKPFTSDLRLTENKMEQRDSSGKWLVIAEGASEVKKITGIFLALLSGDLQLLSHHFDLYFTQKDESWVIGLKARTMLLKKVMAKIVLKGDDLVHEIVTWETNGDQSTIQFDAFAIEPLELSAAEKQLFSGQ